MRKREERAEAGESREAPTGERWRESTRRAPESAKEQFYTKKLEHFRESSIYFFTLRREFEARERQRAILHRLSQRDPN